jgi:hypothetical protein
MSIWTAGLPAWWAMAVAVAALLTGVWLGEWHGRGVGRGQVREDREAARAARQVRAWREPPALLAPRGERTAAFLHPPELHHEDDPGMTLAEADEYWARVHEDQALALANDFSVTAWTQRMGEDMDAFIAGLLAEHPAP